MTEEANEKEEDQSKEKPLLPIKPYDSLPTGGRAGRKEQIEKGGRPDECEVQRYRKYMYGLDGDKTKEIKEKCLNGDILCGGCKVEFREEIKEFIEEHGYPEVK